MASITRDQIVDLTRQYMDAVNAARWSDALVLSVLNSVFDSEWSKILGAAPYYRFAERSVTTDSSGQFATSDLNGGSADAQQNWYRIFLLNDGNTLYQRVEYQDVPLATTSNYLPQYPHLFYLVDNDTIQILPVTTGTVVTVAVNHKPTAISDLVDGDSVITFPNNSELLLAYEAAATLLMKGGTEAQPAMTLKALAEEERARLLDDIRRRTTIPTRMAYPDLKTEWGG